MIDLFAKRIIVEFDPNQLMSVISSSMVIGTENQEKLCCRNKELGRQCLLGLTAEKDLGKFSSEIEEELSDIDLLSHKMYNMHTSKFRRSCLKTVECCELNTQINLNI